MAVVALLALVALVLSTTACAEEGAGDEPTAADPDDPAEAEVDEASAASDEGATGTPPYEVEVVEEVFVDTSRATPALAGTGVAASDERTLPTTIYLPQGEGRFPLVVFSHGVSGHPDLFTRLLGTWAEAGYVVAAPTFPLSNRDVPGEATVFDLSQQPADVSFVIDEVLGLSHEPGSPVEGRIDNERIGVGGLSLGAATTYSVAFGEGHRDDRVDAVLALAGLAVPVDGDAPLDLPTFVAHSPDDPVLAYDSAVEMYGMLTGPRWFLTVDEGGHATAFEDHGHPAGPVVDEVTTAFWDRTLGGDGEVPPALVDDEVLAGLATLEHAGT